MATTKTESVRSIPAPNAVRDLEVRRILQAIIQVLRFYEQPVQEIEVPDEFSGENIGDGKVVLLGKKKGVWQFATLVAGDNVTLKQDGGAIEVSSQDTVGTDTYQVKEASGGVAGYLGEKLSSLGPESGASEVLAGVQEDGTVGIRSLKTPGSATGQVEVLAGAQEDGSIGIRSLIGDGMFLKVTFNSGTGVISVAWTPDSDVTGFSGSANQVAGHASGSQRLFTIVTEVGATGSDDNIPSEQAVREAIPEIVTAVGTPGSDDKVPSEQAVREALPDIVTTVGNPGSDDNVPTEQAVREAITGIMGDTTAATVVTAVQYNTSTKKLQIKTRTITVPTSWLGAESGWTDVFTASTFSCPSS